MPTPVTAAAPLDGTSPAEAPSAAERYAVVVNGEGQHSIWWVDRDLPAGWTPTGDIGTREQCLARIGDIWTDLCPASLRARLGGSAAPG